MDRSHQLPWLLGLSGLVPFAALALALLTGHTFGYPSSTVSFALATYAATIASFLGGIRWGLAVAEPAESRVWVDYLVSVVPQLLAWAALALHGPARLIVLGLIILVLAPLDVLMVGRKLAPPWFGRLRIVLSSGASLCLFAAALAS